MGKWSGRGLSAGAWSGAAGTDEDALGVAGSGVSLVASGPRPPQIELAGNTGYVFVDHPAMQTQAVYRDYYTTPAAAPASVVHFARLRQGAAGTYAGSLSLSSAMTIRIYRTAGQQIGVLTTTLAFSTRYRIEWKINHDTVTPANGVMEVKLFLGDATTPLETVSVTGDFTVGHSRWLIGTDSTTTAIGATDHDDLAWAIGTQTYLGPWVDPAPANQPPTSTITSSAATVNGGAVFTLTLGGSDADGSVASSVLTQISGPTASVSGTGNTRTVTAPAATASAQPMVFQNRVTDNGTPPLSTDSTVTVTVNASQQNNNPTSSIAGPSLVEGGDTFTLTLASSGTGVTSAVTQTAGDAAVSISGTGNTRTVVAPAKKAVAQSMTFRHRVTDSSNNIADSTITIPVKRHLHWKMKNGVWVPRHRGSVTVVNNPVSVTISLDKIADGSLTISWVINPGSYSVDGAYVGHGGPDVNGQSWESALRTGLSGSQTFANLVNGTTYLLKVTPVVSGARIATTTITGTPTTNVVNPSTDTAVAIIGDSLTFRLNTTTTDSRETYTRSQFVAAGWAASDIYWWGRGGKTMNTADSGGKTALQNIAEAKAAYPNKQILFIIGLGTNNGSMTNADFTSAVNTLLDAIGSTNLVAWTNLAYPAENNTTAVAKNPLIKAAVEARGGLYMDWNTFAHDLPDQTIWLVNDSPHLTEAGNKARDAFIIDSVKAWLSGGDPNPPSERDWWGGIGIYNGGPTEDATTLSTFGKYPDISTSYVQPTFGGWNTTQIINQMKRGTAPLATWTTKYTDWITDFLGLNGATAMASAEAQADQYFSLINAALAGAGVPAKARFYMTTCHEHDVYSNTARTDVYYTGLNGDPANYGKTMTKFITRARSKITDPRVRIGMWFGGSRSAHINTVLTNLTVRPDFLSFDPYVNNMPSAAQTAADQPAQSALANFQEKTDECRTSSGIYRANYIRLSAIGGNTKMIPIGITEHGVSFSKTAADSSTVLVHNDKQGASYHDGVDDAVKALQLEFAVHFNRNSGPNGADKTDDGLHPLSVAAESRALAGSDAAKLL